MKSTFSILLPSGDIQTIQARNIVEAAGEYPDAIKIESVDKIALKKRIAGLKADLASTKYLESKEIHSFFSNCLSLNGFEVPLGIAEIASSSNGGMNIDIGGCFMHVSWYQMPVSGKFEIVAYAN